MLELRFDSRYLQSKLLKDNNGKEYLHTPKEIVFQQKESEKVFSLEEKHKARFDLITNEYYNTPNFWWVPCNYNLMEDPFSEIDFTDAHDQPVYPNYVEGERNIVYPEDFVDFMNKSGEIPIEKIKLVFPGIVFPEHMVGDTIKAPSRDVVQSTMSELQLRSEE